MVILSRYDILVVPAVRSQSPDDFALTCITSSNTKWRLVNDFQRSHFMIMLCTAAVLDLGYVKKNCRGWDVPKSRQPQHLVKSKSRERSARMHLT